MSAKSTDDGRVRELYAVIQETKARIDHFELTESAFLSDDGVLGRSFADVLLMCVFRATEEAGKMSEETRATYPGIPWRAIAGMRNIVAHDYGKVDRRLVWTTVTSDFPALEAFCEQYANDHGFDVRSGLE